MLVNNRTIDSATISYQANLQYIQYIQYSVLKKRCDHLDLEFFKNFHMIHMKSPKHITHFLILNYSVVRNLIKNVNIGFYQHVYYRSFSLSVLICLQISTTDSIYRPSELTLPFLHTPDQQANTGWAAETHQEQRRDKSL